jgi:histidinol-phosphate/aromatic aminotransferase/cobyric acid decarboxylase-like protein
VSLGDLPKLRRTLAAAVRARHVSSRGSPRIWVTEFSWDSSPREVTASGSYVLGRHVERFEREFAEFVGVDHAIGVGSGFDALRLALLGLGVGPSDDVILPANTYIATALAVSDVGANPILVDCDAATYMIDRTRSRLRSPPVQGR